VTNRIVFKARLVRYMNYLTKWAIFWARVRRPPPARERGPLTRRAECRHARAIKTQELACGTLRPHASEASSHAEESAHTRAPKNNRIL